jgi:regulator of protease activity HflC (stomatin/prohibitin superfamily)
MSFKFVSLGALLLAVAGCGSTIRAGQRGVKYIALDTPALKQDVKPEGFYWQWAWNHIEAYDVTWQSKTEPVEVLTADDLHINTKVTVTFRPDPARIYDVATTTGREYYDQLVRPPFMTISRAEFATHLHNNIPEESPAIEERILAKLRQAMGDKPIQIDRVSIDHIAFDPALTRAISEKLAMEQALERKKFEMAIAERDADIARTQAKGQADAIRFRAEGEAKAITLKGEAQAQAQSAIGKTLTIGYLQFKAFDNPATRYYFVPTGKNGMPIILGTETAHSKGPGD